MKNFNDSESNISLFFDKLELQKKNPNINILTSYIEHNFMKYFAFVKI